MPIPDWRTDNWSGNKPTFFRHGDPNMHFPRSTKEIGWGWYRPLGEVDYADVEGRYTVFQIMCFAFAVLLICALVPDLRQIIYGLGQLVQDWWTMWDSFGVFNG